MIPKFEAIELGPIDARLAMLNNGYEPIPVWEKKRPVHSNWQNMSITHDEILGWRGVGPHTGLRTKHMPVFDIDILDAANHLAAFDRVALLQIKLHDPSRDPAREVHFGRLDYANGLDRRGVRRRPEVFAAQVVPAAQHDHDDRHSHQFSNAAAHTNCRVRFIAKCARHQRSFDLGARSGFSSKT